MQVQVDIPFEQLLKVVKELPAVQLKKLKVEINKETKGNKPKIDLRKLLLNGPIATKKQIETIKATRKSINQWRTKL